MTPPMPALARCRSCLRSDSGSAGGPGVGCASVYRGRAASKGDCPGRLVVRGLGLPPFVLGRSSSLGGVASVATGSVRLDYIPSRKDFEAGGLHQGRRGIKMSMIDVCIAKDRVISAGI